MVSLSCQQIADTKHTAKDTTMKIIDTPIAITVTFGYIKGIVVARSNTPSGSRDVEYMPNVAMVIDTFLQGILNGGYASEEIKIVITKNPDYMLESMDVDYILASANRFDILVD